MSIPRSQLEALGQTLPSKQGIEHEFAAAQGSVVVSFEVDVKRQASA